MRHIPVREPVVMENTEGEPLLGPKGETATITTFRFVRDRTIDTAFSRNVETIERGMRVRAAAKTAEAAKATSVPVEEDDWRMLCTVTQAPTEGYNPMIAHQCVAFAKDILEAKEA